MRKYLNLSALAFSLNRRIVKYYTRRSAVSKVSSQLHPENYEAAAAQRFGQLGPLSRPFRAILCNPSRAPCTQAPTSREKGWKARVLRGSPIVSSLATINCQNVPHNSVRSFSIGSRAHRICLKLTRSIDSCGTKDGEERRTGPWGPLTPRWIIRDIYERIVAPDAAGVETPPRRAAPTLVPRLVGRG